MDRLSRVQIDLQTGAKVKVEGFGMPFANRSHASEAWINEQTPIVGGVTLIGLLQQRNFVLLVNGYENILTPRLDDSFLPSPFSYPYGSDHTWSMERYKEMIPANKVCDLLTNS